MLPPALFHRFRDVAYRHAGITLKDGKETLVEARIAARIRALELGSAEAYVERLERDHAGEEIVHFLDVISTNFTSFFREPDHFALLTEEARRWRDEGRSRLRVWCAASSTGEEPYTLLMVLGEVLGGEALGSELDWRLLATDISTRVLAFAQAGVYPAERLDAVPAQLRGRFFERRGADAYAVRPTWRPHVGFARLNLARPPYPLHGPLDAIFCRNVMIYFDDRVRQGFLDEAERLLAPGGLLYVGHAETLNGLRTRFKLVRPAVYRKPA